MNIIKRNVYILAACNGLSISSNVVILTISALVSYSMVADKILATVPIALQQFSAMLLTAPASYLMKHMGRKVGFFVGALLGILGGVLGCIGIFESNFILLCVGSFFFGGANAFAFYYRFAVADIVSHDYRARAISYVMAGGVVAAFIGSNLANVSREWISSALYAGSFLSICLLFAVIFLLLSFVNISKPGEVEAHQSGRSLRMIARQPAFMAAVLAGTIGYGLMSFLMCATPLSMQNHAHAFSHISFVIQWHVLGMFAPSFVTGHLIKKFGIANIMFVGGLLNLLCVIINLAGTSLVHYWIALFILGIGWNFLFVSATTLLTETYDVAEKAKVQAFNDFLIFSVVAFTALFAGVFHHKFGWTIVNIGCVPWIIIVLMGIWRFKKQRQLIN